MELLEHHDVLHRRKAFDDLYKLGNRIVGSSFVKYCTVGEQNRRFELRPSFEDRSGAVIRAGKTSVGTTMPWRLKEAHLTPDQITPREVAANIATNASKWFPTNPGEIDQP